MYSTVMWYGYTQKTYCTKGNINNNIINTRELSGQLLFHCKRSSKYYVQQQALSHYHKQTHKKVNTSSNLDLQYKAAYNFIPISLEVYINGTKNIMLSCYTLYIVHVKFTWLCMYFWQIWFHGKVMSWARVLQTALQNNFLV